MIHGSTRRKQRADPCFAAIMKELKKMSAQLDRLTADVAQLQTVDASANALIQGLAQQIRDNANDPAALGKLADDIEAQNTGLAAAVTANTPAAPADQPPTS